MLGRNDFKEQQQDVKWKNLVSAHKILFAVKKKKSGQITVGVVQYSCCWPQKSWVANKGFRPLLT